MMTWVNEVSDGTLVKLWCQEQQVGRSEPRGVEPAAQRTHHPTQGGTGMQPAQPSPKSQALLLYS